MKREELLKKQRILLEKIASILKNDSIEKMNLICCGNSIASGYSFKEIKPLIYRIEDVEEIMKVNGIDANLFNFARAGSNSDEKLLDWLYENISINDVNNINIKDYSSVFKGCPFSNINNDQLMEYFKPHDKNERLGDLVKDSNNKSVNLLIYSGGTGSFLNNQGRDGKHKLVYGIIQDCISMEAFLKYINLCNRKDANNQVYVCGSPNILGLYFNEIMNYYIRKHSKNYPNTSYVSGVVSKTIHKKFDHFDEIVLKEAELFNNFARFMMNKLNYYVDIHYTNEEYILFINKVLQNIIDNYLINKSLIDIDRTFYQLSNKLQESEYFLKENALTFDKISYDKIIDEKILYWLDYLSKENVDIKLFIVRLRYLINEKHPHDYWFLDKKTIKKSLE